MPNLSEQELELLQKIRELKPKTGPAVVSAVFDIMKEARFLSELRHKILSEHFTKILIREISSHSKLKGVKEDMVNEELITLQAQQEGIWPQNATPSSPKRRSVYVPPSARIHQKLSELAGACDSEDDNQ